MTPAPASLADLLRSTLADVYAFHYRAQAAHWNVLGRDFAQYHALFGDIAGDVYGSIDPTAENIRKLDAFTPVSLEEIVTVGGIATGPVSFDPASLAGDLYRNNEVLIARWKTVFAVADAVNEQGIADFAASRIDAHQKWRWFLKSSTSVTIDVSELVGFAGDLGV